MDSMRQYWSFDRRTGWVVASMMASFAGYSMLGLTQVLGQGPSLSPAFIGGWVAVTIVTIAAIVYAVRALGRLSHDEIAYRTIFEHSAEGLYRSTPQGRFLTANSAMARICGYSSPQALIEGCTDIGVQLFADPIRREDFLRLMDKHGAVDGFEYQVRRPDERTVWVSETARVARDQSGRPVFFEGMMVDIGERRRTEERLAALAQEFAVARDLDHVYRILGEYVLAMTPGNGLFLSRFDAATGMRHCAYAISDGREEPVSGLPPLPLTGSPHSEAIRTRRIVVTSDFTEATAGMPHVDIGLDIDPRLPKSSVVVPILLMGQVIGAMEIQSVESAAFGPEHVTALRMAAPLAGMAMEHFRHIEEERRLRQASEDARRLSEAVITSTLDAVITVDAHDRVTEFNPAAQRLFGYTREEALGARILELIVPPALRERHLAELARRRTTGEPRYPEGRVEVMAMRRDGQEFPVEIAITRVGSAEPPAYTGFLRDLTERHRTEAARESLEAQLRESQKMEAIGRLAGGVAHDFNNIVGAILGNAELARAEAAGHPGILESLEEISKAGVRAKDVIGQILAFSRRQPLSNARLDLGEVVEEAVRLLHVTLPGDVGIAFARPAGLPEVIGDATQMGQVLINLVNNAHHAMAGKPGVIDVALAPAGCDNGGSLPAGLPPGDYLRLSVTDHGSGMDAATRERIFEPFFTTKRQGEGTGLGLSVVHGIVARHGGAVVVHSEPGRGSRFEVLLPVAGSAHLGGLPLLPPSPTPLRAGGGEHILYLDDDEALVFLVRRMLERAGFRVSAFQSQEAALAAVREQPEEFAVFVTDYNMPGLSGLEVAREVRRLNPRLPIALASGYITDGITAEAQAVGVHRLIFKPNVAVDLVLAIQSLLPPGSPTATSTPSRG